MVIALINHFDDLIDSFPSLPIVFSRAIVCVAIAIHLQLAVTLFCL